VLLRAPSGPTERDRKLFVGGLSFETTEDTVRNYFMRFGKIIEVGINRWQMDLYPRTRGSD
jgi:RNA recognition motif-containing protein